MVQRHNRRRSLKGTKYVSKVGQNGTHNCLDVDRSTIIQYENVERCVSTGSDPLTLTEESMLWIILAIIVILFLTPTS